MEALIQEQARLALATQHAHNTCVIATFAKRAREAAIATGATPGIAEAASPTVAAEAETAIADAMSMQE